MARIALKATVLLLGVVQVALAVCIWEEVVPRDAWAQCTTTEPGCADYVAVPCANADCVKVSSLDPDDRPSCDLPADTAERYKAVAAESWQYCGIPEKGTAECIEYEAVCAIVYAYTGTPCTGANKCTASYFHIKRCKVIDPGGIPVCD